MYLMVCYIQLLKKLKNQTLKYFQFPIHLILTYRYQGYTYQAVPENRSWSIIHYLLIRKIDTRLSKNIGLTYIIIDQKYKYQDWVAQTSFKLNTNKKISVI